MKQLRQTGMTLIELMISIAIMAMIAAGAYQVLSNIRLSHDRIGLKTQQIDELQRFWYLLSQDAAFATARAIRVGQDDRFGAESADNFEKQAAAFYGQMGMVQLSRNAGLPRIVEGIPQSELRRVAYVTESNVLYRFQWAHMDAMSEEEPLMQLLLEGVNSLTFRYGTVSVPSAVPGASTAGAINTGATNSGSTNSEAKTWSWSAQWPLQSAEENTNVNSQVSGNQPTTSQTFIAQVPNVLEVTVDIEGVGEMTRLFELGAPNSGEWQSMKAVSGQNNQNTNQGNQNQSNQNQDDQNPDDESQDSAIGGG